MALYLSPIRPGAAARVRLPPYPPQTANAAPVSSATSAFCSAVRHFSPAACDALRFVCSAVRRASSAAAAALLRLLSGAARFLCCCFASSAQRCGAVQLLLSAPSA